jgi:hypothetical protein
MKKKILIKIKVFQFNKINWSILYLGRVPLIKIAIITIPILFINIQ